MLIFFLKPILQYKKFQKTTLNTIQMCILELGCKGAHFHKFHQNNTQISLLFRKCNEQVEKLQLHIYNIYNINVSRMFDLLPDFCENNLDLSNFMVEDSTEMNLQPCLQISKTTILRDRNLSACSFLGRRSSNLDRYSYIINSQFQLYGLFDGHSDEKVSTLLSSNLLQKITQHSQFFNAPKLAIYQSFQQIEQQALRMLTSGSTALVVLVTHQKIIIANVGDSMVIGKTITGQTLRLNQIHNFENPSQMNRIMSNGGYVIKRGKQYRLNGQLNLTRSIGDYKHKEHLSFEPQFTQFPKNFFTRLVLVTDGLWNLNNSIINHQTTLNIIDDLLAGCQHIFQDNATFLSITLN